LPQFAVDLRRKTLSGRAPRQTDPGTGTGIRGGPQQSHAHGGQLCPATQAAHAQPQPPPPAPASGAAGLTWTQAPLGHGAVTQTMPSSIQLQALAPSAAQVVASPWLAQGSGASAPFGATIVAGVPLEPLPPTPTLPAPHAQSQGGQVAPGAQVGQAQVHVPPPPAAPPPQVLPPPAPPQSQVHGAHAAPGGQAGHAQVHVPPPLPPPAGGLEQSHATAGQSAFAGHAIGCTQVQPPPEASRAWQ
jgi:hypothetical protein